MEKKVCYFELCLVLIKKNYKSFGGKNLASSTRFFFSSKAMDIFCFNTRLCSNSQKFFPFGNPPYAKKRKRDSLYFDLLPGPLNSADFFYLLVLLIRGRGGNKHTIQVFLSLLFFIKVLKGLQQLMKMNKHSTNIVNNQV